MATLTFCNRTISLDMTTHCHSIDQVNKCEYFILTKIFLNYSQYQFLIHLLIILLLNAILKTLSLYWQTFHIEVHIQIFKQTLLKDNIRPHEHCWQVIFRKVSQTAGSNLQTPHPKLSLNLYIKCPSELQVLLICLLFIRQCNLTWYLICHMTHI